MTKGFLAVDKPAGLSSTAVVNRVKRATKIGKVGHAGTLDPMATGLVVVALGPVTRLIRFVQEQPKEYLATAQFGVATDTLDADGAILSRAPMEFTDRDLEEVASRFRGTVYQVPPMVSALKHEGRRLYELARRGEMVEREARPVQIHELEVLSVGSPPYPEVEFRVVCGKGTYVRALADDMAGALGGVAHLTSLRRIRTGSITLHDHGIEVDRLDDWRSRLLTPSAALGDLPSITVDEETARGASHGVRFVGGDMIQAPEQVPVRVLDEDGELIAIYRRDGDQARAEVVLAS